MCTRISPSYLAINLEVSVRPTAKGAFKIGGLIMLNQPSLACILDQLMPAGEVELVHHVGAVGMDRAGT